MLERVLEQDFSEDRKEIHLHQCQANSLMSVKLALFFALLTTLTKKDLRIEKAPAITKTCNNQPIFLPRLFVDFVPFCLASGYSRCACSSGLIIQDFPQSKERKEVYSRLCYQSHRFPSVECICLRTPVCVAVVFIQKEISKSSSSPGITKYNKEDTKITNTEKLKEIIKRMEGYLTIESLAIS